MNFENKDCQGKYRRQLLTFVTMNVISTMRLRVHLEQNDQAHRTCSLFFVNVCCSMFKRHKRWRQRLSFFKYFLMCEKIVSTPLHQVNIKKILTTKNTHLFRDKRTKWFILRGNRKNMDLFSHNLHYDWIKRVRIVSVLFGLLMSKHWRLSCIILEFSCARNNILGQSQCGCWCFCKIMINNDFFSCILS